MEIEKLIAILSKIAEAIAQTFGSNCEVVVHDLRDLDQTIVKIVNGHVTGRKVGGSITDLGLRHLRSKPEEDLIINYLSRTKSGKTLKSTTICFKNETGAPVAALCVNLDMSPVMASRDFLDEICRTGSSTPANHLETFHTDLKGTLKEIVRKTMENFQKDINLTNKNHKMRIIESLDRQGVFLIKGAVNLIAREMNVSRFTVYNYLEEIRSKGVPNNVSPEK